MNTKIDADKQKYIDQGVDIGFAKGAKKANEDMLKDLGYDTLDSAKSAISGFKESEDNGKTEIDKLMDKINGLTESFDKMGKENLKLKEHGDILELATKNGVKELDFFEFDYNNAKKEESFDVDKYMEGLKEKKPFLFGEKETPSNRPDNSPSPLQTNPEISKELKDARAAFGVA